MIQSALFSRVQYEISTIEISNLLADPTAALTACKSKSKFNSSRQKLDRGIPTSQPTETFFFSVFFRLCRAADGHDGSDQRAEPQPGHPLLGVQAVCHSHLLPQGEKASLLPLSDLDQRSDKSYFSSVGFSPSFSSYFPSLYHCE